MSCSCSLVTGIRKSVFMRCHPTQSVPALQHHLFGPGDSMLLWNGIVDFGIKSLCHLFFDSSLDLLLDQAVLFCMLVVMDGHLILLPLESLGNDAGTLALVSAGGVRFSF